MNDEQQTEIDQYVYKNVQQRLDESLDSIGDRVDRKGVSQFEWFQLAVVAVRALILIASAMWDK